MDYKVYQAERTRSISIVAAIVRFIRTIINNHDLIWQLFKRDFLMSYKKSFLGLAWFFVSPVVGIFSWIVLNYAGVLQPGDLPVAFPVYVLIGTTIWSLFLGVYGAANSTLSSGGSLILQVNYPHETMLFKQLAQVFANFFMALLVNIIAIIFLGAWPQFSSFLLPFVLIPLMLLATAMGLIMSVVTVVVSDLNNIMSILLGFVFYVTPIVYSLKSINSQFLETIIALNPITHLLNAARDVLIGTQLTDWRAYFIASAFSVLLFVFALKFFYSTEKQVIEKLI